MQDLAADLRACAAQAFSAAAKLSEAASSFETLSEVASGSVALASKTETPPAAKKRR